MSTASPTGREAVRQVVDRRLDPVDGADRAPEAGLLDLHLGNAVNRHLSRSRTTGASGIPCVLLVVHPNDLEASPLSDRSRLSVGQLLGRVRALEVDAEALQLLLAENPATALDLECTPGLPRSPTGLAARTVALLGQPLGRRRHRRNDVAQVSDEYLKFPGSAIHAVADALEGRLDLGRVERRLHRDRVLRQCRGLLIVAATATPGELLAEQAGLDLASLRVQALEGQVQGSDLPARTTKVPCEVGAELVSVRPEGYEEIGLSHPDPYPCLRNRA